MNAECSSKAQRITSDIISTLPQTIIETILCLLPIEEAARTSILSTQWRYKWTKIPKLAFDSWTVSQSTGEGDESDDDIKSARKNMDERCKLFYVILQVLLQRQGPINEFSLNMDACPDCFEVDQIMLHLSRNHNVKKLSLDLDHYKLPLRVFSLHQLTDLHLQNVNIDHQPIFSGFGSLKRLCLFEVVMSTKALLHLLSHCPSLTRFYLLIDIYDEYCTIDELFECLPMIEHLTIWSVVEAWIVLDSIHEELPTSLIHLKYFRFNEMHFDDHGLTFLAHLIKCSPNLEKIRLEIDRYHTCCKKGIASTILGKFTHVRLERLDELEMVIFNNFEPEVEFVKFILARSPKLKKVTISAYGTDKEELKMLNILLHASRVSPVEIVIL